MDSNALLGREQESNDASSVNGVEGTSTRKEKRAGDSGDGGGSSEDDVGDSGGVGGSRDDDHEFSAWRVRPRLTPRKDSVLQVSSIQEAKFSKRESAKNSGAHIFVQT